MLFVFNTFVCILIHVPIHIKCIIFLDMYVINLDKTLIIQNICLQIEKKENRELFHQLEVMMKSFKLYQFDSFG